MRIVLVADTFPPLRTSGAVQLRDLSREFARQGHDLTVMLPYSDSGAPWQIENVDGVKVLRLRTLRMKDVGYVRRTIAEFLMPFFMLWHLRKSPMAGRKWDGVVWYAPSIFHGPLASQLKKSSGCKGYLIIRDIFPEWAVDLGLMGRGPPYRFFSAIAQFQYSVADVIGIQTQGNAVYFANWKNKPDRTLEVLQNWLGESSQKKSTIRLDETKLAGRKIFVYAGNMGIAQGLDIIVKLAERLAHRKDVGFLFVGRGTQAAHLRQLIQESGVDNTIFFDEIDPDEIPDLYSQCSVGIVALDPNHSSHNIPGKFLTYMQSGLPVLANINENNDLVTLIQNYNLGQVCTTHNADDLATCANRLLEHIANENEMSDRCIEIFANEFSVKQAVRQIAAAFEK